MNFYVNLSVQEILQNKFFNEAKVVAGNKGLLRPVRWVHVLEVTAIENLLSGNELILSTGVGWKSDQEVFRSLVQQSIQSNAAGLCIELGTYISSIPQEIKDLADAHDFPIIVFSKEVRFIDITQEVHSLLLKKHYKILSNLEEYSNRLNQLLLSPNPQQRILQLLHDYLKVNVCYISNQGKVQIISKKEKDEQNKIYHLIKENRIPEEMDVAHQSVQALSQTYADLFIISEFEPITDFGTLILERSATALAQCVLRELYVEEHRMAKESEWVGCWIDGEYKNSQISRYLSELEPNLNPNVCSVMICKADHLEKLISEFTYLKVYIRSIFEQRGIYVLFHIQKNQIVFILLNNLKAEDFKRRIQESIDCLAKSDFIKKKKFSQLNFSVGKFVHDLGQIKSSYLSAKETLSIREKMPSELNTYFYEDLYIFRLVLAAHEQGVLSEFITDYIGPIIQHDQKNNGELLRTLKIFLECKGAKKETAEHLHIVRQTLYHRLDKIYELIGRDFMESYKRQAIEVAITAYTYTSAAISSFGLASVKSS
ncbi:PucR family transcriptional regulator [Robertmurraya korlensis]|uniref:PucR family transcriptional regulator n=1 Tax=Robertmurraya korlensis TaxID=519977 RepID=UPI000825190C|nr:PucR family transcriptional regulator [Robertmurraya korlensis]